jgi:polyisoprenyl-teichoic acid--peptidoglycan teichoic acid transferase
VRRARRRSRSLALLGGCILASGALLGGVVGGTWLLVGAPAPAAGAEWLGVTKFESSYTGAPNEPFFFLALGNDGRTNDVNGLGDAIHVIGINPAMHQGTMLNVPRDTTAPNGDKINASHSLGGLPAIVDQLNKMMGIKISYAITTNFPGFIDMVNELGGIKVNIPMPLNDADGSGAWFDTPGVQLVAGNGALAFARDRHEFPRGDIDRTFNQGTIILDTLKLLQDRNDTSAGDTVKLVSILASHVRMHDVDVGELYRLGRLALQLDPASIKNITIPVGGGTATSTNLSLGPDAPALFADFADDAVVQSH